MSDLISRQLCIDALSPMACVGNRIIDKIRSLPSAQPEQPSFSCGQENDTISRRAAVDALCDYLIDKRCPDDGTLTCRLIENEVINKLPPAEPEIIHCKDCAKHNNGVGDLEVLPDGKRSWIWKDQACPLVSWRGKAQGHEFDYQYCAYAERRTDERPN